MHETINTEKDLKELFQNLPEKIHLFHTNPPAHPDPKSLYRYRTRQRAGILTPEKFFRFVSIFNREQLFDKDVFVEFDYTNDFIHISCLNGICIETCEEYEKIVESATYLLIGKFVFKNTVHSTPNLIFELKDGTTRPFSSDRTFIPGICYIMEIQGTQINRTIYDASNKSLLKIPSWVKEDA